MKPKTEKKFKNGRFGLEVLDTNREHFKNFHQLERDKLGRFKKIYV